MRGEFLSLETAKKIHNAKTDKQIDTNILEANIKLVDENKILKKDNELLNNKLIKIKKTLKKHKNDLDYEPWCEYKISGNILFELVSILEKVDEYYGEYYE